MQPALLNYNQCEIRRKLNCCEKYERCAHPCEINQFARSKTTVYDLLDIIDEIAQNPESVARGEITEMTDAIRVLLAESISTIGIGLSIEWPGDNGF